MNIVDAEHIAVWPQDNLFSCSKWLRVLSECYGFSFKAVLDSDGAPLLFFSVVADIFGPRVISLPFSDYTDLGTAATEDIGSRLQFLRDAYPELPITLKLLGDHDFSGQGFVRIRDAVCHRIPLAGQIDDIWGRTSHAFRKGVAKATRSGLSFEVCSTEAGIDIFYQLLVELRRKKYRILPQSKDFYRLIFRHFCTAGAGYLGIVRKEGQPVAAALILRSGSTLFDKMGVSDLEFQEFRPNNLLLWEVMKLGNATGATALDMGLTQADHEGLISFKDSLGGSRIPVIYHRLLPRGFDESRERATKALLKQTTDFIIASNPDNDMLAEAGTMLYKYFC
jgi:hypothetical protein